MTSKRIYYIDLLRCLCLACLFLAHVNAPSFLQNIRSFDVTTMVFLSGLFAIRSYEKTDSAFLYLRARFIRLVIPTWIFLTVFYLCMLFSGQKESVENIIKAYLFQRDSGIAGGVWIIWVYFSCALVTPVLTKICQFKYSWIVLIIILIIYEPLRYITVLTENRLLYYTLFTIVPYACVLGLGMKYSRLDSKNKAVLFLSCVVIHIIYAVVLRVLSGEYILISAHKYPAGIYYLSYGLSVSILLLELFNKIKSRLPHFKLVDFISEHSLWIYLWQILFLTIVNYVLKWNEQWGLAWVILVFGSVGLTAVQNWAIRKMSSRIHPTIVKLFTC